MALLIACEKGMKFECGECRATVDQATYFANGDPEREIPICDTCLRLAYDVLCDLAERQYDAKLVAGRAQTTNLTGEMPEAATDGTKPKF